MDINKKIRLCVNISTITQRRMPQVIYLIYNSTKSDSGVVTGLMYR